MTTEPLTPDAVRALIAEAREYVEVLDVGQIKPGLSAVDIILRQAAALEASLPREDADLDAIESRAAWAGSYSTDGVQAAAERFRIAREDVPALIGRVRAAEAERDEMQAIVVAVMDATSGPGDIDNDVMLDGVARAFESVTVERVRAEIAALRAARTVETAEELWGVVLDDFGSTDYYETREEADEARKRAPDTGLVRVVTTTIVPPTPEEAAHS